MLNSEREKLVVDQYKNQNKSIREIAQEARMSFRDIGAILRKAEGIGSGNAIDNGKVSNNNNKSTNEKATQAYKLFSKGKKLVDVSFELDLRENEASKYFHEFLRLKGQLDNGNKNIRHYQQQEKTERQLLKLAGRSVFAATRRRSGFAK
jgi:hypothetical protein